MLHRIARHTIELRVGSDEAARDAYAELSASFQSRISPVLDDVFTAVCPENATVRIDRLEIDAGLVPRERLVEAIVAAARAQLAARLGLRADGPGGAWVRETPFRNGAGTDAAEVITTVDGHDAVVHGDVVLVTDEELALERLAALLERGAVTWRDPAVTRDGLEATLLGLMASAPSALRALLRRLRPTPAAIRIWTQLGVPTRHRLLAWLGIADPAGVDVTLAAWTAVVDEAVDAAGVRFAAEPRGQISTWLQVEAWTLAVSGQMTPSCAAALGHRIVYALTGDATASDSARVLRHLHAAAERMLAAGSDVRAFLSQAVARLESQSPRDTAGELSMPMGGAHALEDVRDAVDTRATSGRGDARADAADRDADAADLARRRLTGQLATVRAEARVRPHDAPATEPLWAAHAGAVIVWPFLPGLFEACGLTIEKRFRDDAARDRAVQLTAYLATGAAEWSEHDLLVEKTMCGCAIDAPLPPGIDVRADEAQQMDELLAAVLQYWPALKSTSVDGLRRAFFCRPGTLTAIASGWKLEIPRAGHDVLLDSIPWGIGVVKLPWMEQPLHVEW